MSAVVAALGALLVASLLVRASFRWGRRRRPCVLSQALLRELSLHKQGCLGEPPERVALELELLFGTKEPVNAPQIGASASARRAGSQRRPARR